MNGNGAVVPVYWNRIDCQINDLLQHTEPMLSETQLLQLHNELRIKDTTTLKGFERYIIENNNQPIGNTMQGFVFKAIDIVTGRRVIIKTALKCLVDLHASKNGRYICEDICKEASILHKITNTKYPDAGMCFPLSCLTFVNLVCLVWLVLVGIWHGKLCTYTLVRHRHTWKKIECLCCLTPENGKPYTVGLTYVRQGNTYTFLFVCF